KVGGSLSDHRALDAYGTGDLRIRDVQFLADPGQQRIGVGTGGDQPNPATTETVVDLQPADLAVLFHPCARPPGRPEEGCRCRRVDDAEHWSARDGETDHDRELAVAAEEILRSIEWVYDPDPTGSESRRIIGRFLGQNRVG